MLVAVPSNHWHVAEALAAEGFAVVHVDQHVRRFLAELDPLINAQGVLANMGGGGRLSHKLDEMRRQLLGRRNQQGVHVEERDDGYRVSVTSYGRNGEQRTVEHDLIAELTGRHPELRRYIEVLRRLLPAPDFAALEGDTVIVGVDTDAQRALLPEGVRCIAIAGSVPPWATEAGVDLHVLDADLSPEEQAATAPAAVRGLVTA